MKHNCVLIFGLFLLCAVMAWGQDARGTVQGVVTDSTDAVVIGARVTLVNVDTGIAISKDSNDIGHYRFDYVSPGIYVVTAEFAGFNKSVRENVLVQTRADVTVDLELQAGGVTESITVKSNTVELQFNTSSRELGL